MKGFIYSHAVNIGIVGMVVAGARFLMCFIIGLVPLKIDEWRVGNNWKGKLNRGSNALGKYQKRHSWINNVNRMQYHFNRECNIGKF